MLDYTLSILGSIFFFGGLIILILGLRRGVTNVVIWSLFPILHGFHEYIEFLIDNYNLPIFYQRFEPFFAVCSSFILLAACIEYLGIVNTPYGKIIGLTGISTIFYFFFFSSDSLFIMIDGATFQIGSIETSYIRLLQGFILPFVSALVVSVSYYLLYKKAKKELIIVNSNITKSVLLLTTGLLIYGVFEGFTISDTIDLLRGISAILLLLIPLFIVIYSTVGLQNLMIFDSSSGRLIYLHFFQQESKLMALKEKDQNVEKWILTAGVLSAISSLSNTQTSMGEVNRINSDKGTFLIAKTQKYSVALQSQTINKNVESSLLKFQNLFDSKELDLKENIIYFDTNQNIIAGYVTEAFARLN